MTQAAVWIIRIITQGHEWLAFIFDAFARTFALLFAIESMVDVWVAVNCQGKQ